MPSSLDIEDGQWSSSPTLRYIGLFLRRSSNDSRVVTGGANMEASGGVPVWWFWWRGRWAHLESLLTTPLATVNAESVKHKMPSVSIDPPSCTRMMECLSS